MTTPAQRKWIDHADASGIITFYGRKGWESASFDRMMKSLAALGLAEPFVALIPKWKLTDKGGAYQAGAREAERKWEAICFRGDLWSKDLAEIVCGHLENSLHAEIAKAGAKERWLDLRAGRVNFDGRTFRRIG